MKDEQAKSKHEEHKLKREVRKLKVTLPQQQHELNDFQRGQRCLKYELKKVRVRLDNAINGPTAEEDLNAC